MRTQGAAWVLAVAGIAAAGMACGGRGGSSGPAPGSGASTATTPAADFGPRVEDEVLPAESEPSAGDDAALARRIDRAICRKRGCCVSALEKAGSDRKRRPLMVATIDGLGMSCLAPEPAAPSPFGSEALDLEKCPYQATAETSEEENRNEGGAEDDSERGDEAGADAEEGQTGQGGEQEDCRPYEYHLIVFDKAQAKIVARQLLSEACNNGYGFAGVGEDAVSVDAETRTFSHSQSGGSNWRWSHDVTVGLDPLRIVSEGQSTFWTMNEEATSESAEWDWDRFAGKHTWPRPDCAARRKKPPAATAQTPAPDARPAGDGDDRDGQGPPWTTGEAVDIPFVQLPPAFAAGGWRATGLGACAAVVDGAKEGYAIYGGAGAPRDASMRVVLSRDDVLYVEVTDDRFTSNSQSWVKEDHVELWLGGARDKSPEAECDPNPAASAGGPKQWGIRIADGAVFAGFGAPAPLLGVEVARAGGVARLRIPLAATAGAAAAPSIAVVYSDSDDGLRQERLIATSQVERGELASLGEVREVDPKEATCVIKGSALRVARAAQKPHRGVAMVSP